MVFLTVQLTTRLHKFPRLGPFGTSSERLLPPLTTSLPAYLEVSLISPTHQLRGSVITHRHCVSFATPVLAHTCLNVFKINFYL